jgi:singapore isolate B (sub-type 7) whole genome shotgun sequence assembly, scaffold_2
MKKSSFKLGSLGVAGIVLVGQASTVAFADEIEKKAFDVDRTRFEKLTAKAKELGIELIIGDIVKDVPTVKDAKEYQVAAQADLDSQLDKLEKALNKYVEQKEKTFDVETIGTIRVAAYVVNPHTVWVTVSGKVLKEKVDGIQGKEEFDGYTYVKREINDDATIKYIYQQVETSTTATQTTEAPTTEAPTTEAPTTETPTTEAPTTEAPTTGVNAEKKAPTTKKLPNTSVGIIGGIASVLGLTGVGAYFNSRKRKK